MQFTFLKGYSEKQIIVSLIDYSYNCMSKHLKIIRLNKIVTLILSHVCAIIKKWLSETKSIAI